MRTRLGKALGLLGIIASGAACGGGAKPAGAPAPPAAAEDAKAGPADAGSAVPPAAGGPVPTTCATPGAEPCVPEHAFVKRLCDGSFPDVALTLLGKDTPFARVYLRGDVDGWNADGGASARARLHTDEEVLVLRRREAPKNGIVVGAGGGYLVMRWDGNCYTLEDGELATRRPRAPRHAPIPWRFLEEKTRDALLARPKVLAAFQKRGKECKGAVSGEVSRACEQADASLSEAVVAEVRGGIALPAPEKRP